MHHLVRDGHNVCHITSHYPGSLPDEMIDGIHTLRVGGRYSVYIRAWRTYRANKLNDWTDIVIDEMNTIPFASCLYSKRRNVLLAYQLARSVWFYQMRFPFSLLGYLAESIYLRLIAHGYSVILTESESTRQDMVRHGFPPDRIHVFRIGMSLQPLASLPLKSKPPLILSLGSVRPMKRTLDAVKAFEYALDMKSPLRMIIAGDISGTYGRAVRKYVGQSRHSTAIEIKGRVADQERLRLMREASVILVTSIKEGWGLIVTEANSQGTPAIVYNSDGLRDSVHSGKTGLVVARNNPKVMGQAVAELVSDKERYAQLQEAAWQWSREFTFENSYKDFVHAITS